MARGEPKAKSQQGKYTELNPEDTIRGGMKTPVYGEGKITHHTVDYPNPVTPSNPLGLMGVGKTGKGRKK